MPSVPALPQEPREPGTACPFVGRATELQLVVRHAGRQRVEGPGIAVVSGVAGMGRTAFLRRVADRLVGHFVLRVDAGKPAPFALANRLVDAMHERGFAEHVPLCQPGDAPHLIGQRLLTALTTVPTGRPVTVVIDDVQHADVESSLALGFAARRMYGQQILFLLAVRSADGSGTHPNVRRIMPARGDQLQVRLNGLSVEEIQSLGHALGVIPLRHGDASQIRRNCEGNPRYVTRLLEEIRRDPHARMRRLLPSFSTTIMEQIGRLPEASRALIHSLAVLGERCPLSTAATVAEVAQPLHALEPLLAAGLVEWWPAEPTTPVGIRTPLQLKAAYEAAEPQLRRALHERAARVLPFDRALEHRVLAAQGRPDPALAEDLAAAAWRWTVDGNLARAAQYTLWAADATERGERHDHLLLLTVSLLQRDSQYEAATVLQDRARACAPSALRNCVMGRFAMIDGDLGEARDLLEAAIAAIELDPSAPEFGVVAGIGYTWLALVYAWLGETARARAAAGRCLEVSPFGGRIDRGTELVYLSMCCTIEGPVVAMRRLAGLVNLPAAANEVDPADSMLLILRGHFRLLTGEPAEAVADIETGLSSGRHAGINELADWGHLWAASAHIVLGSWDRAIEHATAALDIVATDGRPHLPSMLGLAGYIEANLGELAAAVEHATAATDIAENFSLPSDRMLPALATAAIARAKGDPLGAVEALRPFAGPAGGWLRVNRWMWWPAYVDALTDLGRIDDAEGALAGMAADIASGYRVLMVPHLFLFGRVMESGGNTIAALSAYERAAGAAPALGHREWRARAADSYRRLAHASGASTAEPLAGPLNGSLDGPPAGRLDALLTERERMIVSLITDGLTNKAVGGYLGITEKTIEAHLTRVYRKLAVKSRSELQAAVMGATKSATTGARRRSGPPSVSLAAPCARSGSKAHQKKYGNGHYRDAGGGPDSWRANRGEDG